MAAATISKIKKLQYLCFDTPVLKKIGMVMFLIPLNRISI